MTKFIAEVSSNHSNDLDRALKFIDVAASVGCDAVKFQLFKISQLFAPEILRKSEAHRSRKNWELKVSMLGALSQHCKDLNIQFGCTPFYLDAVDELYDHVDFYKVSSYELLWKELLSKIANTKKPVILSTGMATMAEIIAAVELLSEHDCRPTLLHCTSAYPTPPSEANLSAIETIRNATNCEVGWSDHTVCPGVIYRAVQKWNASCVEFHLDLDGNGDEYKTGHCWLPEEIRSVIQNTNDGLNADGDGAKEPTMSELPDRDWRADPSDGLRPFRHIRKAF
jgi:N-acetylneuraminate synthase